MTKLTIAKHQKACSCQQLSYCESFGKRFCVSFVICGPRSIKHNHVLHLCFYLCHMFSLSPACKPQSVSVRLFEPQSVKVSLCPSLSVCPMCLSSRHYSSICCSSFSICFSLSVCLSVCKSPSACPLHVSDWAVGQRS